MAISREFVRCNKPRCTKCPHGPYYYQYWRDGKRTLKRYLGRTIPAVIDTRGEERGFDWWHCQTCGYKQPYLHHLHEPCPQCGCTMWKILPPRKTRRRHGKGV
jgi:hypothetical protein